MNGRGLEWSHTDSHNTHTLHTTTYTPQRRQQRTTTCHCATMPCHPTPTTESERALATNIEHVLNAWASAEQRGFDGCSTDAAPSSVDSSLAPAAPTLSALIWRLAIFLATLPPKVRQVVHPNARIRVRVTGAPPAPPILTSPLWRARRSSPLLSVRRLPSGARAS